MVNETPPRIERLDLPMQVYREMFKQLQPLPPDQLYGSYNHIPLGTPRGTKAWMIFGVLVGLPGMQGKIFDRNGEGFNLCFVQDGIHEIGPIYVNGYCQSVLDGKPSLMVRHRTKGIRRWVIDEFRILDQETIMGMGYFKLGALSSPTHPFLLKRGPVPLMPEE